MLLIEKTIKLLDDFHYQVFYEHVKHLSLRSYYPLVLLEVISRELDTEQDAEKLCNNVYAESDEKAMKKFYQLAHYTFKLTSFLAKNYPDYLQSNFTRIQKFINEGHVKKANLLAELVLDVSEKVEDYVTHTKVLQFLVQQSVLLESTRQALNYLEKTGIFQQYIITLNNIFTRFYTYYNLKQKDTDDSLDMYETFFRQFFNHDIITIRLTSLYCYCFLLHYKKDKKFYTKETFEILDQLEKDFEKFDYIIFPYLVDFSHRVRYLKLRYEMAQSNTTDLLEHSQKFIEGNKDILYWNSYINQPEIFSITIQVNHLTANYMKSYRENHMDLLPADVRSQIQLLLNKCKALLDNQNLREQFTLRYINLTTIYSMVLVINGKEENLKEAIERLKMILFNYQQLPFHNYVDAIYNIMGIAYFCLRNFDKVDENYKRYKKATKNKPVSIGNDITIHVFYYTTKWLETGRNQYLKKLEEIIKQTDSSHLSGIRSTFLEIVEYFKLPVSFAGK